uniref:Uncharacterized protein n=1 Tax=Oryza sativa subsp. japonica TaxID=39947 RepID=Q8S7B4_ORYSJ|nr:Hypothetical protein [Oryza sativa Japonica Group]
MRGGAGKRAPPVGDSRVAGAPWTESTHALVRGRTTWQTPGGHDGRLAEVAPTWRHRGTDSGGTGRPRGRPNGPDRPEGGSGGHGRAGAGSPVGRPGATAHGPMVAGDDHRRDSTRGGRRKEGKGRGDGGGPHRGAPATEGAAAEGGGSPRGAATEGAAALHGAKTTAAIRRSPTKVEERPGAAVARCRSRQSGGGARVHGGIGASGVDLRSGPVAGMRHGAAALWEAAARPGEVGIAGGERLETEGRAAARFSRWGGVEAGARHGEAKPTAHTARRGGGWGGGKKRPVNSGERRLLGLARGERARAPGARESWGNGRGDHGDRFYWLGAVGSWPRRAESTGNGLRSGLRRRGRSGVVRRRFWRGKVGEESGGGGATRSRGQGERAGGGGGGIGGDVGRPWRRFRLREPEVRDGPDRWDPRVPPVGERGRERPAGEAKQT